MIRKDYYKLPKEYQEVEYIESTGTQYINTNLFPSKTHKIDMDFSIDTIEDGVLFRIFGTRNGDNKSAFICGKNALNSPVIFAQFDSVTPTELSVTTAQPNKRTNLKLSKDGFYIDDVKNREFPNSTNFNPINPLILFGYYNSSGNIDITTQNLKIYKVKIYNNNVLIRNMIPCYRKSDNVIGMYDTVNSVFYTNTGTGTFNKGNDVYHNQKEVGFIYKSILPSAYQQVEYIESTGTQYINTGIVPDENTRIDYKIYLTELSLNQQPLIGARTGTAYDNRFFPFGFSTEPGGVIVGRTVLGTSQEKFNITVNTAYEGSFRPSENASIINNVSYILDSTTYVKSQNNNVYIFATSGYGDNLYNSKFRLYYLKIYQNNTLVRSLIPCYRKDNNVIGLYDNINNTFYTNAGTGTFNKGNDVEPNIDKVYKGTDLVFEQGFTREQFDTVPLTTEYQAIGKDLLQYQIYGETVQRNIPDEYQQVQYLESDGNQYINLGITTGSSTDFEIKLATTNPNPTTIKRIFGGYSDTSKRYELGLSYTSNGVLFNYYGNPYYSTYVPTLNEPFVISKKGSTLTSPIGDVALATESFTNNTTAYLFATNRASTENFIGRIYYMKIYNGSNLIMNLFPCYRKSDNVIGMYDTVSNTLFVNQGTGAFTKGSNVTAPTPTNPIDIQSVGDLVTDSGDPNYNKYKIPVIVSSKNIFDGTQLDHKNITNGEIVDRDNRSLNKLGNLKAGTYTICSSTDNLGGYVQWYNSSTNKYDAVLTEAKQIKDGYVYRTFTLSEDRNDVIIANLDVLASVGNVWVVEGNVPSEYEKYFKPITTNIYLTKPLRKITDRDVDYADYIDFNEGKVYRVIGEYVFDSTHYTFNSIVSNNIRYFYRVISDVAFPIVTPFVTHYNGVRTFYSGMPNLQATVNGGAYRSLYVRNDSYTTNTDFNNHIKSFADGGNPMTMYYVLPVSLRKTENVTLPDLPTFKATTTFTIGSNVNGSSMYIKYKSK